jgi:hypothetical protein
MRYCTKEDTRVGQQYEWGVISKVTQSKPRTHDSAERTKESGKRRREYEELAAKVAAGDLKVAEIVSTHPAIYGIHHRAFQAIQQACSKPRFHKPFVLVLHGVAGSGKTRYAFSFAMEHYTADEIYKYDAIGAQKVEWWEGYRGQPCIIMDEMNEEMFRYGRLLTLIDRYPSIVGAKGTSHQFKPEMIIITSNSRPSQWFPNAQFGPLRRRIDDCRSFEMLVDDDGHPLISSEGGPVYEMVKDHEQMRPNTEDDWIDYQHMLNSVENRVRRKTEIAVPPACPRAMLEMSNDELSQYLGDDERSNTPSLL